MALAFSPQTPHVLKNVAVIIPSPSPPQFYASSRWFNWTDAMEDMLTGTFPMLNVLTKANGVSFNSFS